MNIDKFTRIRQAVMRDVDAMDKIADMYAISPLPQGENIHHFRVLEFRGRVIGFARVEPDTHVLSSFAVREDFRRMGFGKKLLESVIEDCRQQGWRDLSLGVYKDNPGAIAFYKTCGFVEEGDASWTDGVLIMVYEFE